MVLMFAKLVAALVCLYMGVHLLREAKMRKDKPKEPVWWKAPERWVEDPELLGLFLAVIASGAILQTLWQLARLASRFFAGE